MYKSIVYHLFNNSVKYSNFQGFIKISVDYQQARESRDAGDEPLGFLVTTISDSGSGIDQATMRKICQTLVEGRDRSRYTLGSGIKTAHELCEWMNGGLVIFSEPDQGCVVKFKVAASHKATSIFKSGKNSTMRVDLH